MFYKSKRKFYYSHFIVYLLALCGIQKIVSASANENFLIQVEDKSKDFIKSTKIGYFANKVTLPIKVCSWITSCIMCCGKSYFETKGIFISSIISCILAGESSFERLGDWWKENNETLAEKEKRERLERILALEDSYTPITNINNAFNDCVELRTSNPNLRLRDPQDLSSLKDKLTFVAHSLRKIKSELQSSNTSANNSGSASINNV